MKLTVRKRLWGIAAAMISGLLLLGFLGAHLSGRQESALRSSRKQYDGLSTLFRANVLFQGVIENYQHAIVQVMLGSRTSSAAPTRYSIAEAPTPHTMPAWLSARAALASAASLVLSTANYPRLLIRVV